MGINLPPPPPQSATPLQPLSFPESQQRGGENETVRKVDVPAKEQLPRRSSLSKTKAPEIRTVYADAPAANAGFAVMVTTTSCGLTLQATVNASGTRSKILKYSS